MLECRGTNPHHPKLWKWPDFGRDCYNFTAADANAAHGVGNEAYTLTGRNGDGEAYFHVETSVENDFLRCSAQQPCSIVVVPNWGGVQNPGSKPGSSTVDCADHSGDVGLVFGNYALDTSLGQACSWGDRIVVPLSFAPTPQNCPVRNFSFVAEGAPVLARTFQQWRSAWCLGKSGVNFDFDSGVNESPCAPVVPVRLRRADSVGGRRGREPAGVRPVSARRSASSPMRPSPTRRSSSRTTSTTSAPAS